jgi:hypothetical protein
MLLKCFHVLPECNASSKKSPVRGRISLPGGFEISERSQPGTALQAAK